MPPSTCQPDGVPGTNAALGAAKPVAPLARRRPASSRHAAYVPGPPGHHVGGERRLGELLLGNLHGPHGPADAIQVGRLGDLLVPEELGPRAIRRLREVLQRALAVAVPACGRLL